MNPMNPPCCSCFRTECHCICRRWLMTLASHPILQSDSPSRTTHHPPPTAPPLKSKVSSNQTTIWTNGPVSCLISRPSTIITYTYAGTTTSPFVGRMMSVKCQCIECKPQCREDGTSLGSSLGVDKNPLFTVKDYRYGV